MCAAAAGIVLSFVLLAAALRGATRDFELRIFETLFVVLFGPVGLALAAAALVGRRSARAARVVTYCAVLVPVLVSLISIAAFWVY